MDKCTAEVLYGHGFTTRWGPCGEPAKGVLANGQAGCGKHIGIEKRTALARAKADAKFKARTSNWERGKVIRQRLGMGFVTVANSNQHVIALSFEEAEVLIKQLGKEK